MWRHFYGPIKHGLVINHKNGIKTDNRIGNLEVVTESENQKHGYRVLGRTPMRGEKVALSKLTKNDVIKIRKLKGEGLNNIELGEMYGVHKQTICNLCTRRTWRHVP